MGGLVSIGIRKPLIVGMNNPYGTDPYYALYPLPVHSAGGRLYQMLKEATGISRHRYLEVFDRINLCSGPWSLPAARETADAISRAAHTTIVMLGKDVQRAFCMSLEPLESCVLDGATFHALPHPSGLNPWYNQFDNRQRAKELLRRLYDAYAMALSVIDAPIVTVTNGV